MDLSRYHLIKQALKEGRLHSSDTVLRHALVQLDRRLAGVNRHGGLCGRIRFSEDVAALRAAFEDRRRGRVVATEV